MAINALLGSRTICLLSYQLSAFSRRHEKPEAVVLIAPPAVYRS